MSFRLVPKSVTVNDLERRNRPNGALEALRNALYKCSTYLLTYLLNFTAIR